MPRNPNLIYVTVGMPAELLNRIEAEALKGRRTRIQQIIFMLEESFSRGKSAEGMNQPKVTVRVERGTLPLEGEAEAEQPPRKTGNAHKSTRRHS